MKHNIFVYAMATAFAATAFVACRCGEREDCGELPPDVFDTVAVSARFYVQPTSDTLDYDVSFYLCRACSLVWPKRGFIDEAGEEALLKEMCLSSLGGGSIADVAHAYVFDSVELLVATNDNGQYTMTRVDTIDHGKVSFLEIMSDSLLLRWMGDSGLPAVMRYKEIYLGGAHSLFGSDYHTYDRAGKKIVRLADLVDTAQMLPVIARAIETLDANEEQRDCVEMDRLHVSDNFFIDERRTVITLVYQPYEIACFACGEIYVALPIDWLNGQTELTPYAKKLFGID